MAPAAWAAVGVAAAIISRMIAPHAAPVVCPPVAAYTAEQEHAMADAVRALPADNPLVGAMADYIDLRKSARACKGAK